MADILATAQTLYTESLEALSSQRKQIEEDLAFSDPSNPQQWDEDVKRQRESDPGGKRPCLVMDQIGQYVSNVSGQVEKQPPSIHAIPVGGGAEKQAAEQIDGRFRHIEHASRASQHYTRALTSAARAGVGYLIIRPEYIDRALGWQEPRIGSEPDPLKVIFDPWSVDTDGADATFGFVMTEVNLSIAERKWKGKVSKDFGALNASKKDDNRKSVLLAEQWYQESDTRTMIIYTDLQGEQQSAVEDDYDAACDAAGAQLRVERTYKDKYQCVKWRRMSGSDVLEESDYPAESIGIVPMYGYVSFQNGRMRYCGISRRARAPQQAYNYHMSEQLAYIGTAPKSPWLASKRAAQGVEDIWDRASIDTRGWMPFNDWDENGAIAAPTRPSVSMSLGNHEAGAQSALRDIQASIGMYQANLGAQGNETSGVAIENRKQQGEASTAHFPSHMAASLGQVGNIVMQMDAKLTDGMRKQPIVGVDGTSGSITTNPNQQQSFQRLPNGGGVSINPNVGKYGVRVVVGASYSTQRTQTNAAFAEIMRGNKELSATVAPFWAQTLDFPGSDKFAQAMAAMSPPPVKAILQPEGESAPDPAAQAQQIAQLQEALQEAIQHAKDAQEDADLAIAEAADAKRLGEVKERENDIKAYSAETDRLKVVGTGTEANAKQIVQDLINQMLQDPDPLPDEPVEEKPEMQEPQGPSPELQAIQAAHKQTAAHLEKLTSHIAKPRTRTLVRNENGDITSMIDKMDEQAMSPELQAIQDGHKQMADHFAHLQAHIAKPRKRVPVRDEHGDITHVIDQVNEQGA